MLLGSIIFPQSQWIAAIRTVWEVDPAIAVHFVERFKQPAVMNEVNRSVRSNPRDVLHVPEAVRYLLGERVDSSVRRDLRVCSTEYPAC